MRQLTASEIASLPSCPVCGARHEQATLGDGRRAWCDGSPVERLSFKPHATYIPPSGPNGLPFLELDGYSVSLWRSPDNGRLVVSIGTEDADPDGPDVWHDEYAIPRFRLMVNDSDEWTLPDGCWSQKEPGEEVL